MASDLVQNVSLDTATQKLVPTGLVLPPEYTVAGYDTSVLLMDEKKPVLVETKVVKKPTLSALTIFKKCLLLTDGRDKFLKVIQYFSKLLLLIVLKNPKRYPNVYKRMSSMVSAFSSTRKILRLGNFLEPYGTVQDVFAGSYKNFSIMNGSEKLAYVYGVCKSTLEVVNCISDDIFCLSKMGVVPKSWGKRSDSLSTKLWFVAIWLDIHELVKDRLDLQRQINTESYTLDKPKLQDKMYWNGISIAKLLGDLAFCGYDFFKCDFSETFQVSAGFISGALGTYKLWVKKSV
ncbi:hypothetical protein K493DRAFT_319669 [Basidiobolus meristosporus CBS 931.73]|uniref:Peroxisomal biogenesis factor 11 n=1 Tax=Basidiobolus meristosporus CBS 931.73 TaxID=1314790 RepID=A0A1Y1XPJ0_9FUNG|nr:hypothetical protein K493DRAFT_319669 [Basidiobolus meristosporus CBS 931.73]|eukprot:ORX87436.1 hypothetical protein K493DRAFT_319669 [Basidiobolus meristosporus CBS 931.73]